MAILKMTDNKQSFVAKEGIHDGEITCIGTSHSYVAIGSADNSVSIWRLHGMQLFHKILVGDNLPSYFNQFEN